MVPKISNQRKLLCYLEIAAKYLLTNLFSFQDREWREAAGHGPNPTKAAIREVGREDADVVMSIQ
jgi:hypothetical protein